MASHLKVVPHSQPRLSPMHVVLKLDIVTGGERFSKGTTWGINRVAYQKGGFLAILSEDLAYEFSDEVAFVRGRAWGFYEGP